MAWFQFISYFSLSKSCNSFCSFCYYTAQKLNGTCKAPSALVQVHLQLCCGDSQYVYLIALSRFCKYQSLEILCLQSWQAGKTIMSGDPFPCIHLLLFYFIGYVHCNMLWTQLLTLQLPEVQFCSHLVYIIAFNSLGKLQEMVARTPCAFTIQVTPFHLLCRGTRVFQHQWMTLLLFLVYCY